MSVTWTDEQVVELKAMHSRGLSMSEMATALGSGFSRSAIIGKVHRLKLPSRGNPAIPGGARSKAFTHARRSANGKSLATRKARSAPPASLPPRDYTPAFVRPTIPAPTNPPVRFADLDHGCHYIEDDACGPDTLMCGAPIAGRGLCEFHLALCWVPAPRRDRSKASLPTHLIHGESAA